MRPVIARENDLQIRPLTGADELKLFYRLRYTLDDELEADLVNGIRRPAWMWVALRGGRLIARAAWRGDAAAATPSIFDFLDLSEATDRVDVGVRLISQALGDMLPAGTSPPDYIRFVEPDWQQRPDTRRLTGDLIKILSAAGADLVAERFRFEWRPETPIAAATGRLTFRAVADDHELLALMTAVLDGTLDAYSQRDLQRMSARDVAAGHLRDELTSYTTPREWWQIATLPGGEPVGFVIPTHNSYGPIIAYIGVLPAHRGRGYIDEILAQGTRTLAEHQPPRIRASTDLENIPMARAFARAGWSNFERSINMSWPHPPKPLGHFSSTRASRRATKPREADHLDELRADRPRAHPGARYRTQPTRWRKARTNTSEATSPAGLISSRPAARRASERHPLTPTPYWLTTGPIRHERDEPLASWMSVSRAAKCAAAQLRRIRPAGAFMRAFLSRRRRGAGLVVALLIISVALASANRTKAATAVPHGALTPLTGTGSCLGGSGCAPLRGFAEDPAAATSQTTVDVSYYLLQLTAVNGGQTMYVTDGLYVPWAIAILSRDPSTGAVSQLAAKRGCITTHVTPGCAQVPPGPHTNDLAISPDGKRVAVESFFRKRNKELYLLLSRNPATGTVRRLGGWRSCVALIDGVCGEIHGLRIRNQRSLLTNVPYDSYPLGSGTRIITGHQAGAPGGYGVVVQHRNHSGQWHEIPGAPGCTDQRGTPGCRRLTCLQSSVTDIVAGHGNHVYVIGGGGIGIAYVATFQRTRSGGLQPVGCVTFAPHEPTGEVLWIQPLPHSSTVLLAAHDFDHETGFSREAIYASTPGSNGALTRPHAISGPVAFSTGDIPALSPDGTTLYGADSEPGKGGLYVYEVTSTAVTALPSPWFNPYSPTPTTGGEYATDNGVNDTPVVSPDGRFVYTVVGPFQNPSSINQPEVHAYQVQP